METKWLACVSVPLLEAGSVQVWRLDVAEPKLLASLEPLLSPAEVERAGRTRSGPPRDEFIVARGALRWLLGKSFGKAPEEIEFKIAEQGKPTVVNGGVEFNVSHSGGCVLVALSRAGAVGVDLEPVGRGSMGVEEAMELARANLHPAEIAAIAAETTNAERLASFYRCWTRKEAIVKADGRGLYVPLADFCVLGEAAGCEVKLPGAGSFWVRDVRLEPGFCAALAVPEREISVTFHRFAANFDGAAQPSSSFQAR